MIFLSTTRRVLHSTPILFVLASMLSCAQPQKVVARDKDKIVLMRDGLSVLEVTQFNANLTYNAYELDKIASTKLSGAVCRLTVQKEDILFLTSYECAPTLLKNRLCFDNVAFRDQLSRAYLMDGCAVGDVIQAATPHFTIAE